MSTLVFLHAHPDDECSSTGGTIATASALGHRVVVVFATNGEHGESPHDLAPGETLVDRRQREVACAAAILGSHRTAWLGYSDSGMNGWEQNEHEHSFHAASLDEASAKLAAILDEEAADVVIGYDWHGGYGHPDHVKVHGVVHRAAQLAARRPRVLEATQNRDQMRNLQAMAKAAIEAGFITGPEAEMAGFDPDAPMDDGNPLGTPEADIHWAVDVHEHIQQKRQALACHASQATDVGMFMSMPEPVFEVVFGTEYFVESGRPVGMQRAWFLDG